MNDIQTAMELNLINIKKDECSKCMTPICPFKNISVSEMVRKFQEGIEGRYIFEKIMEYKSCFYRR